MLGLQCLDPAVSGPGVGPHDAGTARKRFLRPRIFARANASVGVARRMVLALQSPAGCKAGRKSAAPAALLSRDMRIMYLRHILPGGHNRTPQCLLDQQSPPFHQQLKRIGRAAAGCFPPRCFPPRHRDAMVAVLHCPVAYRWIHLLVRAAPGSPQAPRCRRIRPRPSDVSNASLPCLPPAC